MANHYSTSDNDNDNIYYSTAQYCCTLHIIWQMKITPVQYIWQTTITPVQFIWQTTVTTTVQYIWQWQPLLYSTSDKANRYVQYIWQCHYSLTLLREKETYKGWTVLGQVDLDGFVDSHVNTAAEFEDNFKAVKTKRREAEKLPETIKVGRVIFTFFFVTLTQRHNAVRCHRTGSDNSGAERYYSSVACLPTVGHLSVSVGLDEASCAGACSRPTPPDARAISP